MASYHNLVEAIVRRSQAYVTGPVG